MDTFPGGVLSGDGKVGIVHVTGTQLVAIDLLSGNEIWRRESNGRPIAASQRNLVVLIPNTHARIEIYDIASGTIRKSELLSELPDWLTQLRDAPEALQVRAADTPGGLTIEWQAERRYAGGTMRKRQSGMTAERQRGQFTLSLDRPEESFAAESLSPTAASISSTTPVGYEPMPGELSRKQVGNIQYVLRLDTQDDGSQEVTLESVTADQNNKIWKKKLGAVRSTSGPGPLRK